MTGGASTETHAKRGRLRAFLDHHAAGDREALGRLLAEDAVWHVGGRHLSSDLQGREAILDYFDAVREETDGTFEPPREQRPGPRAAPHSCRRLPEMHAAPPAAAQGGRVETPCDFS